MNIQQIFITLIILFVLSLIFSKQLTNIKFWFVQKKLEKALRKKDKKRLKVKHRLLVDLRNYLRLNGISEYIPYDHKSREKIESFIQNNYGEELRRLDINYKITKSNGFKFL